ncbi:hypothetical protein [Streptomyces longhuiensis]|uniref:hypothetical protein n=1 Tax=Streptomyces longhuiensis TaxID=2880933 RepID=UPI001D0B340F|nr:hypothetical protein [Streptomyces longhuiensis]UDM00169.1 hypothetical protein LGI35_18715 [Streptomyces longhuiensis]
MTHQSHDATTVSRPRLLPWSSLDGKPCYLVGDGSGNSHLARLADNVESVQLDMAEELLDHAADLLAVDVDSKATAHQLHFLAARLVETLHDVHRIARSRGARLTVPDDDDDDDDDEPVDAELQTSTGRSMRDSR